MPSAESVMAGSMRRMNSMNKIKITIWGREFDLDVIYQTFSNKGVIENQETVLSKAPYADFEKAEDGV